MQGGKTIGQLQIADFTSGAGLAKQGDNYFRAADPAGQVAIPNGTSVEQGKLEASNSGTAESAVRLISIMRQFEMLQKAAALGTDMDKQAIEQVARVSP
jgi:flagellar basal-body rod protein FlgG